MLRARSICTSRNSCSKVQHISWLGQINSSLCTLSLGCCNMSYHLYDSLKDDFPHDALFKCVISSPPRFLMTHASVLSVRCLTPGSWHSTKDTKGYLQLHVADKQPNIAIWTPCTEGKDGQLWSPLVPHLWLPQQYCAWQCALWILVISSKSYRTSPSNIISR